MPDAAAGPWSVPVAIPLGAGGRTGVSLPAPARS